MQRPTLRKSIVGYGAILPNTAPPLFAYVGIGGKLKKRLGIIPARPYRIAFRFFSRLTCSEGADAAVRINKPFWTLKTVQITPTAVIRIPVNARITYSDSVPLANI